MIKPSMLIRNFAVFEGIDGSGTTTQLRLLSERFAARPPEGPLPPFHATFEPTDGPVGRLVRAVLRGDLPLKPATVARLFSADRNEHLYGDGGIADLCEQGVLVVSDRYTLSSIVYQGITCGEDLPRKLNGDFPLPELLLFFDIDPETAQKRLETRKGRDIYEYLDFQIKARERYRALLPEYAKAGVRVEYIDAAAEAGEVAEAVWRTVEKMPIISRKYEKSGA
jgi:dTMP kinase